MWGATEHRKRCAARFSETGTGFAYAKLSEARSSPRVARVVRVTQKRDGADVANDDDNLTPNPFPSWEGEPEVSAGAWRPIPLTPFPIRKGGTDLVEHQDGAGYFAGFHCAEGFVYVF